MTSAIDRSHPAPALCAVVSALACALGTSGCAVPYLDTAQAAYRVDPVMVQWNERTRVEASGKAHPVNKTCPRPPTVGTTGEKNTRDGVDVLCPLDLDTFVFHQNRNDRDADPAYMRVLKCQEKVAPVEFNAALAYEIQALGERLNNLRQQSTVIIPQRISREGTERDGIEAKVTKLLAEVEAQQAEARKLEGAKTDEQKAKLEKAQAALAASRAALAAEQKALEAHKQKIVASQNELARVLNDIKTTDVILESNEKLSAALAEQKLSPQSLPTPAVAHEEAVCITLRNQLQSELITRSKLMCEKHLSDVKATAAVVNSTLGFGSLAQSTLASIVTGQTWARILAAGASVTTGTQAVLNKEIYKDFVVPAITRAINQERTRLYNAMHANRLRTLMEYSAGEAMSDVAAYHESCSFANGLELIGNDAEKRVEQSIPELEARIKALLDQIKITEDSLGAKASEAEKKIVERSKLRLRSEIQVLQARVVTARQSGGK